MSKIRDVIEENVRLKASRFRCVQWLKKQMELGTLNNLGTKFEARFWFQLPDSDEKREIEEILRKG